MIKILYIMKFKKTILSFIFSIFVLSCFNYNINELPMYGNRPKTKKQKEADEKFIIEMTKTMSREKASQNSIKRAWTLYYENDFITSMKRFNQAWLLDPNNYEIYWGFGLLCAKQKKYIDSIYYLNKSLKMDNNNDPEIMLDLGFSYTLLSSTIIFNKNKKVKYLNKSIELFSQSEQIYNKNGLLYNNWAISLMELEKYEEAWEKLQKAIELNFQPNPNFIKDLKKSLKK